MAVAAGRTLKGPGDDRDHADIGAIPLNEHSPTIWMGGTVRLRRIFVTVLQLALARGSQTSGAIQCLCMGVIAAPWFGGQCCVREGANDAAASFQRRPPASSLADAVSDRGEHESMTTLSSVYAGERFRASVAA